MYSNSPNAVLTEAVREDARVHLAALRAARASLQEVLGKEHKTPAQTNLTTHDAPVGPEDIHTPVAPEPPTSPKPVAEVQPPLTQLSDAINAPLAPDPTPIPDPIGSLSADDFECDLGELPGIGPNLVGLFQSAGICSLAELAIADPMTLTQKMGLIGQILDLNHLSRCAREATLARDRA